MLSTIYLRSFVRSLVNSPASIAITFGYALLTWLFLMPLFRWAVLDADFLGTQRKDCAGTGACWVFVRVWFNQILFGRFPIAEQWRLLLLFSILAVLVSALATSKRRYRRLSLLALCVLFPPLAATVPEGRVFGLVQVDSSLIGGLSLNLLLAITASAMALPLGILLAMARQSELRLVRSAAIAYIEIIRGVPLIVILFAALLLMPLILPPEWKLGTLFRAYLAIAMFYSAYFAEVIRGGLQTIPRGQFEAGSALGLGYWKSHTLIIVPQAINKTIPALVNTFIDLFKDSTLVSMIGIFDVLGVMSNALRDLEWQGFSAEAYIFVAIVYFFFCQLIAMYGRRVEREAGGGSGKVD